MAGTLSPVSRREERTGTVWAWASSVMFRGLSWSRTDHSKEISMVGVQLVSARGHVLHVSVRALGG